MKIFFTLLASLFLTGTLFSQNLHKKDRRLLENKEDSMKTLAIQILQANTVAERFNADSLLTKILVRALRIENSFYYPFDSLFTISHLYAPDSAFRIFTWQLVVNENLVRQHGAIQMRTKDGTLKLFPLIDKSDVTIALADTVADNYGWIGAVYYKIVLSKFQDRNYYTLLGYDENNIRSNRKFIEVLHFNKEKPVFGGPYFLPSNSSRYIMEYKKEASPRLAYDADLGMIVVEHLVSETNEPKKKWTLIGDGDYQGFKWINGNWVYIEKIFHDITPENKEPVPAPLIEDKLNMNSGQPEKKGKSTKH